MEPQITWQQIVSWIEKEYCVSTQRATDLYRKFLGEEHAAMFKYVAELIETDQLGELKESI